MLVAGVFERFAGLQIQRALNVFVGFRNAASAEDRVFFDFQQICRNMLGAERERFFKRISKRFFRLRRYREHKVEADILNAAVPKRCKRGLADLRAPLSAEQGKFSVNERLNAHADASDAVFDKRTDKRPAHVFGVHFNRYLRAFIDLKTVADGGKDSDELFRRKHGRRAAADIDRADGNVAFAMLNTVHKRADVVFPHRVGAHLRIKIAIRAL